MPCPATSPLHTQFPASRPQSKPQAGVSSQPLNSKPGVIRVILNLIVHRRIRRIAAELLAVWRSSDTTGRNPQKSAL